MADTRTGPQVQKLVEAIQGDVQEAVELVQKGHAIIERLAGETKGVNGTSALFRGKAKELAQVVTDLEEEAAAVEKKMLGATMTDEIESSVDSEKARAVSEARG